MFWVGPISFRGTEGARPLSGAYYLFNRVLRDKSRDGDLLVLSHPQCSSHGLIFDGRIPLGLDDVNTVCNSQVEPTTVSAGSRADLSDNKFHTQLLLSGLRSAKPEEEARS